MINTGKQFSTFLLNPESISPLPQNVTVINPYGDKKVIAVVKEFCNKFYSDTNSRTLILGINPGRFGGGVTGIPFTDAVALEKYCSINNAFPKTTELSSRFIYSMIEHYGGAAAFYSKHLLTAACPLGFLLGKKNYNYYDTGDLINVTNPIIENSFKAYSKMNINMEVIISLGKKNAFHLEKINKKLKIFKEIIILEHPRYIMQYKMKQLNEYIKKYCDLFKSIQ